MSKIKKVIIPLIIIVVICSMAYYGVNLFSRKTGTICLVRGVTGFPCPSCGTTRAFKEIMNGNISRAFYYHPLFALPLIVVILIIIKPKYFLKIIIIAMILLAVVYIIRMVVLFPNNEPMKYNERSVFQQLLR